jgi:hypothetical protein
MGSHTKQKRPEAPVFLFYHKFNSICYFVGAGFSAGFSVFAAPQHDAFASLVHSFAFAQHSVLSFFAVLSFVEAVTVEAAKPMVKATAKIIANFFML